MKSICDLCRHQEPGFKGGVTCGKAYVDTDKEGYGLFKRGSLCVHDDDLYDHFEARTNADTNVKELAETIERQNKKLMDAQDKILQLESSLLKLARGER